MLILILVVTVVLGALGVFIESSGGGEGWLFLPGVGVIVFIATLIAIVVVGNGVAKLGVIDEKIAMYQEENKNIEEDIEGLVVQYMKYESDTYGELKNESAVTLVSLYPELKADELVKKQLDIYVANNEKIKQQREEKIEGSILKWWLHFGH